MKLPDQNWNLPGEAEALGFATFNNVPHLCVHLPDQNCTLTVRTSDGRLATLAFLQYRPGGPPQCVDVVAHKRADHEDNIPEQDVRVFGRSRKCGGLTAYHHDPSQPEKDERVVFPSITTVIFPEPDPEWTPDKERIAL